MGHHLPATSGKGKDLTELGALLNETVQLLTNALHSVAALGKVATIGAAGGRHSNRQRTSTTPRQHAAMWL
jgi:hypothetical protein